METHQDMATPSAVLDDHSADPQEHCDLLKKPRAGTRDEDKTTPSAVLDDHSADPQGHCDLLKAIPAVTRNEDRTMPFAVLDDHSADPQEHCDLLNKLPAEIRNEIYALAIRPDNQSTIALTEAQPPSKSLTLTCKIVHHEAHQLYLAEYRSYWRTTRFTLPPYNLSMGFGATLPASISKLNHLDIHNMEHLAITSGRIHYSVKTQRTVSGLRKTVEHPGTHDLFNDNYMDHVTCSMHLDAVGTTALREHAEHQDSTLLAKTQLLHFVLRTRY